MGDTAKTVLGSCVSGIVVGVVVLLVQNWTGANGQLIDTVSKMQSTQQIILYRLKAVEPVVPRARNNTELIRRICDKLSIPCNVQNAVLIDPTPRLPEPPAPQPVSNVTILHDKRLMPRGHVRPT